MAEISAADVMKLRNKTGLSMMECKKALQEASGDAEAAENLLRMKLKGKMDTRTDRAAGEGRVGIAIAKDGRSASIVELRAESDFTAKNESFVSAVERISGLALASHAGAVGVTPEMTKLVDDLRISTGENISLARAHKAQGTGATMYGSYVHHDGKTAVLLQCEGSVSEHLARDICMHIAASPTRPQGVTANDIPPHIVDKERQFRIQQAMETGKPKEIAEKIVEGGIRKFFEEVALVEQPFIRDESKKIKDLLPKGATITAFYRWQVGEEA